MTSRTLQAEHAVDCAAAAVLAGAIAFSASLLTSSLAAAVLAAVAFVAAYAGLKRLERQPRHALPQFDLQRIERAARVPQDPDDGNVVTLFEPRHLVQARPSARPADVRPGDAEQALSDALAQLKRSLR